MLLALPLELKLLLLNLCVCNPAQDFIQIQILIQSVWVGPEALQFQSAPRGYHCHLVKGTEQSSHGVVLPLVTWIWLEMQVLGPLICPDDSDTLKLKITKKIKRKSPDQASLVVQWFRICLPIQGIQVRPLVQEDPICYKATELVRHNY